MSSRQRLRVRGIVQGVGFRPFVHRTAHSLALAGWVRNDAGGVSLEVQGDAARLEEFRLRLRSEAPPAARIDTIEVTDLAPEAAARGFAIRSSEVGREAQGAMRAVIGPDLATCPACLGELFDPGNRRYRYAFTNCTDCGPRYTIARQLPYDRAHTSMAGFTQCPACQAEYDEALDRRFHAEPNACPECGPRLMLLAGKGEEGREKGGEPDPIAGALAHIRAGGILALKGLGGFQLVCDARNAAAVATLRQRKDREEKPLAVMVANVASLAGLAQPGAAAVAALESAARPIVLLPKLVGADVALPGVAPDLAWLGAMLPCAPLHWLLFHEAAGRPAGTRWLARPQELALVMTSANPHGEPLVTDNTEALATLANIADAFLLHDREIVIRADDSVLRCLPDGGTQFIRRARGYTPLAISLKSARPSTGSGRTACADVLALGGFYKNTLCFTRGDEAFLSQHIGDLDRVANCRALEAAVEHLQGLLRVQPQAVAHDLHPDFFSTRLAQQLAERWQVPTIGVQHHHAHIAAVLAEQGVEEPVLGLALDGVGLGADGTAWGGELLRVEGAAFERLGHLRPIALPGGDAAAREPWRMGAAALALLGRADEIATRFAREPGAAMLAQMLARNAPTTTSLGRWFDAAAGLLGVQARMSFEGQAAMRLEGLAAAYGAQALAMPLHVLRQDGGSASADGANLAQAEAGQIGALVLDLAPALAALVDCRDAAYGAALFHAAVITALADWVGAAAESTGLRTVACGGGCFLNAIIAQGLRAELARRGLHMLEARAVPPGDGGLALGQAWVARKMLAQCGFS